MRLLAVQYRGGVDVRDRDSDALDDLSSSAVGIGGGHRWWASAVGISGGRRWGASAGGGGATLSDALGGGALAVPREGAALSLLHCLI